MSSNNGDALSEHMGGGQYNFPKRGYGAESPRSQNRQLRSIQGGGPETLLKNNLPTEGGEPVLGKSSSFFGFLNKKQPKG